MQLLKYFYCGFMPSIRRLTGLGLQKKRLTQKTRSRGSFVLTKAKHQLDGVVPMVDDQMMLVQQHSRDHVMS